MHLIIRTLITFNMRAATTTIVLCFFYFADVFAQSDTVLFAGMASYPYPAPFSAYTARFDKLHRPYLYTANKEFGVIFFDFSDPADLKPVRIFTPQNFQGLKPTDLFQVGNLLYVSLGGFDGFSPQNAGLAIIDIATPAQSQILGQWSDAAFDKGAAAVLVSGNLAFIGAMERGVILIDVADPAAPKYSAHVAPDLNWPAPPGIFSVPHARGFALRGQHLWTCLDAGGLRLIDLSDPNNPKESVKYINTALYAAAQPAYNTAVLAGDYLFAAVDYCGFEGIDISDPAQPKSTAWVNPWNCNNTNWDGSPGHTNQTATACHDSLLFLSGGDSEVLAYSIADPAQPHRLGQFAVLKDSVATWGVDVNDSLVVLAQIWNPLLTPYVAKKGGIRLLRWSCPQTSATGTRPAPDLRLSITPNPVQNQAIVRLALPAAGILTWQLTDMWGRTVQQQTARMPEGRQELTLNTGPLPGGVYQFSLQTAGCTVRKLLIRK